MPDRSDEMHKGLMTVLWFSFWTGVGLLFSTQLFILNVEGTWYSAMVAAMPRWYIWGLLTPLMFKIDGSSLKERPLFKRLLMHGILAIIFGIIVVALRFGVQVLLSGEIPGPAFNFFIRGMYWDALIYLLIMGVYISFDSASEAQRRQLRETQLEAHLVEARLRVLQAQLQPHFLFNALNTISAYTETDPRMARKMMAQLGDLLRASLDHAGQQKISLEKELALLETYLAIERCRFDERLNVQMEISENALDALVPGLILQPLVENAIRHGINRQMRGGAILISANRHGQSIELTIQDDGVGLPEGWTLEDHGRIGLLNTVQRLEELYLAHCKFEVTGAPGRGVRVYIEIPYEPAHKTEYARA